MPSKEQTHGNDKSSSGQRSSKPAIDNSHRQRQQQTHPTTLSERARLDPRSLSPRDAVQLQRTIGNQAVGRLLAQAAQRQPVHAKPSPKDPSPETQSTTDTVRAIRAKGGTTQADSATAEAPHPNHTGLPGGLKSGIESLSGMSMDNVNVHYNSAQPAELNALAYTQGSDIHVASGQERHLPHEAWHVVQQAQGRVQPTMQMQDGVPVNDDEGLEHEADVMGVKALQIRRADQVTTGPLAQVTIADPRGIEWRDASEFRRTAIVASGDKVGLNSASTWPVPPEQASPPPIQRLPMSNKGMKDCGFQWYDGDEWIWWNEKGKEPNHVSAIRTAQEVKHIHAKTTFKGAKVNRVDWEESDEGDWEGPKTNKKQAAEEWDEWLPQAMAAGESTIRWLKTFRKE